MLIKLRKISKEKLKNSRVRHVLKTISWRLVGSIDTMILATFVTKSPTKGGLIALAEVATKMILYYLHERVWYHLQFGIKDKKVEQKRHIAKSITWRIIGTLDTMMLAWIISGNMLDGFKIGMFELLTKMVLYYFHERIWIKINVKLADENK